MTFDGATFDPGRDGPRLERLLDRVKAFMADGRWHTLAQIVAECGGSEASCSARLRDCRKEKFGGHRVEREYVADGVHRYRLVLRKRLAQEVFRW